MQFNQKVGVVIGRFQPFHNGHVWLIKESLKRFQKIIIIIGTSTIDQNNPWSIEERVNMVSLFLEKERLEDRVIGVYKIDDVPSDDDWLGLVLEKIGDRKFVAIGDNEWVNKIFEKNGHEVLRIGYYNRDKYEGVKIRNLLKNKKEWRDRVPKYIADILKN